MTTVLHAIVNDQLDHNLFGILAVEGEVLAVATDNLTVLAKAFLHTSATVRRVMLDQASWANVLGVILRSLGDIGRPAQRLDFGGLALKECDGLLDSCSALLRSEGYFALTFQKHAIELLQHLLQVVNEVLRVFSN